ncbi:hypothetical protein HZS_2737 [Henneguya salminicola]|nr:hypothetical protein HZS_2737 [Henneguya salminicola]
MNVTGNDGWPVYNRIGRKTNYILQSMATGENHSVLFVGNNEKHTQYIEQALRLVCFNRTLKNFCDAFANRSRYGNSLHKSLKKGLSKI